MLPRGGPDAVKVLTGRQSVSVEIAGMNIPDRVVLNIEHKGEPVFKRRAARSCHTKTAEVGSAFTVNALHQKPFGSQQIALHRKH